MIDHPIFILGSERSGTTILYNLLAFHPDTCWFSQATNKNPRYPELSITNKLLRVPYVSRYIRYKILKAYTPMWMRPSEGEKIYNQYGFKANIKTTEKDIADILVEAFSLNIKQHMCWTGGKRFLNKIPANTQRIRLLNTIFPDAYYIHIVRDGRAVANSLLQPYSYWWPSTPLWWKPGNTPQSLIKSGVDRETIAALHWVHNIQEIYNNRLLLKGRYLEIRYEQLVSNSLDVIKQICLFCELQSPKTYIDILPRALQNMNTNWQQTLTRRQQQIITSHQKITLKRLQYI